MKLTGLVLAFVLCLTNLRGAGIPVFDAADLAQAIKQFDLTMKQLEAAREELKRLGDPESVKIPEAAALVQSLGLEGAGETIDEIQSAATGIAGAWFDANGIFRPPGDTLQRADGQIVPRSVEQYRKFDALAVAVENLKEVMHDTQERRQSIRGQVKATQEQLRKATTVAEVEKLQAVLIGQNSELVAIEMDRAAALGRVLVQNLLNETDAARQRQAHREEAEASVHQATDKLGEMFKVDTSIVRIPSPFEPRMQSKTRP